jgi:hypothetical protein
MMQEMSRRTISRFPWRKLNSYAESAENVEEFAFAGFARFAFIVVGRVFGGAGVKAVRIEQPFWS